MKPKDKDWRDKLVDLIEKECEECPKHKEGKCYMNEILAYVESLIKEASQHN